jgi:hypothetical protein
MLGATGSAPTEEGGTVAENATGTKASGWRSLSSAHATLLAALIGAIPATLTGLIAYRAALPASGRTFKSALEGRLSPKAGFSARVYPRLGLAFMAPDSWIVDDAAVPLGGGEIDVVKRYETSKAAVGIKFRIRSVQGNYVSHHDAEIQNELDPLLKVDPGASAAEVLIGGRQAATMIQYKKPTGLLFGDVRYWWIRLDPRVKLEIYGFIYTSSPDRVEFWSEVDDILSTLVVSPQKTS